MRVLVIEDDKRTAEYLSGGLGQNNYVVDVAHDGLAGRDMALEGIYDIIIVDRLLPTLDGINLVKQLREKRLMIPILMLSALGTPLHKSEGLLAGCDDYLSKPYAFIELVTRLEILLNRYRNNINTNVLQVEDLQLDRETRIVTRAGKVISLQLRESLILEKLMLNKGQVVTRLMLLESAWNYAFDPKDNIIDKHIYKLRQKMDIGFSKHLIHTVTGQGYTIRES
ncbi:DNA-binding response regulator [Gammaproteobacteria bacterium ESL0073]|nr:DNA-binding response regulator [Gammaproteobacteria bacterium ESL0073]